MTETTYTYTPPITIKVCAPCTTCGIDTAQAVLPNGDTVCWCGTVNAKQETK